jgi:hypothetical protein
MKPKLPTILSIDYPVDHLRAIEIGVNDLIILPASESGRFTRSGNLPVER